MVTLKPPRLIFQSPATLHALIFNPFEAPLFSTYEFEVLMKFFSIKLNYSARWEVENSKIQIKTPLMNTDSLSVGRNVHTHQVYFLNAFVKFLSKEKSYTYYDKFLVDLSCLVG